MNERNAKMNLQEGMLLAALVIVSFSRADAISDGDLEAGIMQVTRIFDNPRMADYEMRCLIRLCDGDTNRFTAALANLAVRHPEEMPFMLQEIGRYGNATNLPFLYACVTNSPHADCAVMAVCRIGGVTWELTNVVATAFEQTNMSHEVSENICLMLLGSPPIMGRPLTNAEKGRSIPCVISQAKRENIHVDWIDRALRATDPSYAYSRRRLEVMRSVLAAGPCASRYSYVTNVIHELTSCPETDLSD